MSEQNERAKAFKALHVPGKPLVVANAYDTMSAATIAGLKSTKALASASYAIAMTLGTADDQMDLETNMRGIEAIGAVAARHNIPFTADIQNGYGDKVGEAVTRAIAAGAVGANLEDCDNDNLYPADQAVANIKAALAAAAAAGVPDFVLNARADAFRYGGDVDEVIRRGKLYLEAGATTVFPFGGPPRGISTEEITKITEALDGKVNASMALAPGKLTAPELAKIGVARISIGPALLFMTMGYLGGEAEKIQSSVQ